MPRNRSRAVRMSSKLTESGCDMLLVLCYNWPNECRRFYFSIVAFILQREILGCKSSNGTDIIYASATLPRHLAAAASLHQSLPYPGGSDARSVRALPC